MENGFVGQEVQQVRVHADDLRSGRDDLVRPGIRVVDEMDARASMADGNSAVAVRRRAVQGHIIAKT